MFKEESTANILGIGDDVVKFIEQETDEVVCYLGRKEEKDVIFFHKPVLAETIVEISDILSKKKMRKALEKGDFKKAQRIADKLMQ